MALILPVILATDTVAIGVAAADGGAGDRESTLATTTTTMTTATATGGMVVASAATKSSLALKSLGPYPTPKEVGFFVIIITKRERDRRGLFGRTTSGLRASSANCAISQNSDAY
jgi:hypothetical protein